mmetsp:Transcript_25713/g.48013  ORF Transcript_25713/g.48013 Transcript_25713/m.48013 type:complete len:224 (-) Transcript_25713:14-685(-)
MYNSGPSVKRFHARITTDPICMRVALSSVRICRNNPNPSGARNLHMRSIRRSHAFRRVSPSVSSLAMTATQSFSRAMVPVFAKNCATTLAAIVAPSSPYSVCSEPMKKLVHNVRAEATQTKALSIMMVKESSSIRVMRSTKYPDIGIRMIRRRYIARLYTATGSSVFGHISSNKIGMANSHRRSPNADMASSAHTRRNTSERRACPTAAEGASASPAFSRTGS